ncbi:flagellar biosynthetic protein FliQ [Litoreibacter roseus]|uniref:Flagellar biosynthetic protein FliQ n=1 Tax=Litoreibacter roseus TaxID=2601869 RepID=A0A6N6JGR7_9RHOB|nr:flagellar biosynthetic protein FliQ [Litoreibacter roseus]GFE64412.1 flagellar biosynthetic protein FliQ [Litoreibacter roseus]
MLTEAQFFDVLRQGLWVSVIISAPVLAIALIVGLTIGLFQALTSIQEMTLTFVPKVAAMLGVFWVSMTFMSRTLTNFWVEGIIPLVVGG